jgi:hypothetical protein
VSGAVSTVRCRKRCRGRVSLHNVFLLLLFFLMVGGCGFIDDDVAATRTVVSASPSPTLTPAGDRLFIDDEIVRAVFIPDPLRGALYALTDTDLYALVQGRWVPTGAGNDGRKLLVDPSDPDRLLRGDRPVCGAAATGDAAIPLEISEDGGHTWRVIARGRNIRPLLFDDNLPSVVFGSDCGLAISSDGGETWRRVRPMPGYDLSALAVDGERLIVLGTSRDGHSQVRWLDVTDPEAPIVSDPILELPGKATLDARGGRIIVGALDAVHISDDAGLNWATSRIGLEGVTAEATVQPERGPGVAEAEKYGIRAIRIEPHNIHRIYAGTPSGLFISQDDGVIWVRYTQVSVEASVIDIQFGLNDADLYITTTDGVVVVPSP